MIPIAKVINGAHDLLENADRALESGEIDEAEWYRRVTAIITPAYLAADNPRGESGHGGDEARWTRARSLIVDAIDRDGMFLDVGCANGYLMECVQRWSAEKGFRIEPHGLDIAPALADLARRRLPLWRDRIYVGNALGWTPPMCFAFVRTGLEYVPRRRQRDYVEHLMQNVVAPRGRLIVGAYNEAAEPMDAPTNEQLVASWGYAIAGRSERQHSDPRVRYRVIWIDRPGE